MKKVCLKVCEKMTGEIQSLKSFLLMLFVSEICAVCIIVFIWAHVKFIGSWCTCENYCIKCKRCNIGWMVKVLVVGILRVLNAVSHDQ